MNEEFVSREQMIINLLHLKEELVRQLGSHILIVNIQDMIQKIDSCLVSISSKK